jgi:hypothetical protein
VFPIIGSEFIGLFLLIVVTTISTVGGIGGGSIVIPFCMTFFGFSTKAALAISNFSIFSCSLMRYLFQMNQRHPDKNAVLIDYGLATIMLPTVMMGSMIGVLGNIILPSLILQICLTLLLVVMTFKAGLKGYEIFKKENVRIQKIERER